MPNTPLSCPKCGGNKSWTDPERENYRKCKYCGTEFEISSDRPAAPQKIELPPVDPNLVVHEEQGSGNSTAASIMAGFVIFVVIVLCIGSGLWINSESQRNSTTINTIGQYVIPRQLQCPDKTPAVVEYGFRGEPPILQVVPGVAGMDRWEISSEEQNQISDRFKNQYVSVYLWVHCVNPDNKPEYYLGQNFFGNVYRPVNGVQVVYYKP